MRFRQQRLNIRGVPRCGLPLFVSRCVLARVPLASGGGGVDRERCISLEGGANNHSQQDKKEASMATDILFTFSNKSPTTLLSKFKAAVLKSKTWTEVQTHPDHFVHTDANYKGGVLKAKIVQGVLTIEAYFVQGSEFGKAAMIAGALLYFLAKNLQPDAAAMGIQVR